jgi:hypothetical protein
MPPGAAGGQSRPGIEGATDVYGWTSATDPGVAERHWSWEERIALAYRASLGASQITSNSVTDRPDFRYVTWCGFGHPGGEHDELADGRPQPGPPQRDQAGDVSAFALPRDFQACATSAKRRRSRCTLRHQHHPASAPARPAAAMTGPGWIPKVKPTPDYRRSSSRVTRLRPPVLDLTRRLRHR